MVVFCDLCQRLILLDIKTSNPIYKCICGAIKEENNVCIINGSFDTNNIIGNQEFYLERAPFDRTNKLCQKDCIKCGSIYMTEFRIGVENEITIFICKCGYKE